MKTQSLAQKIEDLESYIPKFEVSNLKVSKVTVEGPFKPEHYRY